MDKKFLILKLKEQNFPSKIVGAFERVNREKFVPEKYRSKAYGDTALPIGENQTISQPYTLAFMLMLLDLEDNQKILEVGSGSGYVLALIDEMLENVDLNGIERIKGLYEKSREVLNSLGKEEIDLFLGQGAKGLKEKAPFDRILVSASADKLPQELVNQLKVGGILVVPVRDSIVRVVKKSGRNEIKEFGGFRFVPLVED